MKELISFKEFVKTLRTSVEDFEQNYQDEYPDMEGVELDEDDWFEEFLAFIDQ